MPSPTFHVVYAHPYPSMSVVTRHLLEVFLRHEDVTVHSLYNRYPDCNIDAAAEQQALLAAPNIVWLCPIYWYSVPGLMKLWFEKVLASGWAYGAQGRALEGRRCWWVTSTGGEADDYTAGARHQRPFADFIAPVEQTARYCGMRWEAPFVAQGVQRGGPAALELVCRQLADRIESLRAQDVECVPAAHGVQGEAE